MLHPADGESVIQVNHPSKLNNPKIIQEQLSGVINRSYIAASHELGVSVSISLLGQGGTSLVTVEISHKQAHKNNALASLTQQEMFNISRVC